jgi:hypothetical protein
VIELSLPYLSESEENPPGQVDRNPMMPGWIALDIDEDSQLQQHGPAHAARSGR